MEKHVAKGLKVPKKISSDLNLVCMESTNYYLIIGLIIIFVIVLGFCMYKLYIVPSNIPVTIKSEVPVTVKSNMSDVKSNNISFPSEYNWNIKPDNIRYVDSDTTDIQAMVGNANMTGMPAIPLVSNMPRTMGMIPLNPVLRPETLPWVQPVRPNLYDRRVDFALVGYVSRKHYQMMPLYGRMTRYNSNKYEYYVIDTDTNIKIPVYSKNDNELYTNDDVFVNEKRYRVTIYDMDEVRY
jgi:hypothetical protein